MGQVLQRYYGFYASRLRGMRRKANDGDTEHRLVKVDPEPDALREARRRWAEALDSPISGQHTWQGG